MMADSGHRHGFVINLLLLAIDHSFSVGKVHSYLELLLNTRHDSLSDYQTCNSANGRARDITSPRFIVLHTHTYTILRQ